MKNNFTTLVFWILIAEAIAQPTITSTEFDPVSGTVYTGTMFNAAVIGPGSPGSGLFWNFISATSTGSISYPHFDPSIAPFSGSFPTATIAMEYASGFNAFYEHNTMGYYKVGEANPGWPIPLTNNEKMIQFPFTYGTTWSDAFAGNYTSAGDPATRSGTLNATVDGYGTLDLPGGVSVPEILRVKIDEDYTDVVTTGGGPVTYTYDNTIYYFIHENVDYPVLIHVRSTTSTSGTSYYGFILSSAFIGIGENGPDKKVFSMYPNPSRERLINISFKEEQGSMNLITVCDAQGRLVKEVEMMVQRNFSLDLSDVDAGIYLVQICNGNGKFSQKLVLE